MTKEERREYNRKRYKENRLNILAGYRANAEERRKYGRDNYQKMQDENPGYAEKKNEYRKKWAAENPGKIKTYQRRDRERSVGKKLASQAVRIAVRSGRLLKPSACESCKKISRLHGHHNDYTHPLVVEWLCQGCHLKRHRK